MVQGSSRVSMQTVHLCVGGVKEHSSSHLIFPRDLANKSSPWMLPPQLQLSLSQFRGCAFYARYYTQLVHGSIRAGKKSILWAACVEKLADEKLRALPLAGRLKESKSFFTNDATREENSFRDRWRPLVHTKIPRAKETGSWWRRNFSYWTRILKLLTLPLLHQLRKANANREL